MVAGGTVLAMCCCLSSFLIVSYLRAYIYSTNLHERKPQTTWIISPSSGISISTLSPSLHLSFPFHKAKKLLDRTISREIESRDLIAIRHM